MRGSTADLNDCFRVPDALMPLDRALEIIEERVSPVVGRETVPLERARGRVLAESPVARLDHPAFDNAAMDGYAVRYVDLKADAPVELPVVARVAAGHPLDRPVPSGAAVRIFTGAPLPDGLDTVVMQEDCSVRADGAEEFVTLPPGIEAGNFVRRRGEDFSAGRTVLHSGRRLRPQDVAMAAAAGTRMLEVCTRLRVGVFSTGDEIVEPGETPGPGQIFGSNRFGMMAALEALGVAVTDLGHLPDRRDVMIEALGEAARAHDLLITSGGVSVGGEDHVLAAVRAQGDIHTWRLALKPGKPTALGTVGQAVFVGLPGYPVSSLVTFMMVARPVILRLSGAVDEPLFPPFYRVRAGFTFEKKHSRRQFLRVSVERGEEGPVAVLFRSQEPHVLSSLIESEGLVDVPADCTRIEEGELVRFIPYCGILPV